MKVLVFYNNVTMCGHMHNTLVQRTRCTGGCTMQIRNPVVCYTVQRETRPARLTFFQCILALLRRPFLHSCIKCYSRIKCICYSVRDDLITLHIGYHLIICFLYPHGRHDLLK